MEKDTIQTVPLSTVHPDFNDIVQQLQAKMAEDDKFLNFVSSSTIQTLIALVGSVGSFAQFSIESALQETVLDYAKYNSSVRSIARTLGARLTRKSPASATFIVERPTSLNEYVLPAYSMFEANGQVFYNRNAIVFPFGENQQTVTLYKGIPKAIYFMGLGTPFQRFISEESDFVVADSDVAVFLNDVPITVTTAGLYHFKNNQPGVQDRTTADGRMILTFGNSFYGSMPSRNDAVVIRYVVTDGLAGNDTSFMGTVATYQNNTDIKATAQTILNNGSDETDTMVYRYIAPHIYSAGDTAVSEDQYNALAATYPGVIDALLEGQRIVAPDNKNWMNLVRTTLLTSTPWGDAQWQAFTDWFYKKSMLPVQLVRHDPKVRNFEVEITVACRNTVLDLNVMESKVRTQLTDWFKLRFGILKSRVFLSDLYRVALNTASEDISYVVVNSPKIDIITSFVLENVGIEAVPTPSVLTPSRYFYAVTILSDEGEESLPIEVAATTTTDNPSIKLQWNVHPFADKYRIYGRTKDYDYLLAEVAGDVGEYVDMGQDALEEGRPPTVDTLGVYYPYPSNIIIHCMYDEGNRTQATMV